MTEEFELKDTKALQLKSLSEFMKQFDYFMNTSYVFEFDSYYRNPTDKNRISFRTAVTLYNEENLNNHGKVYDKFGFSVYQWEKAKSSKITEQVFLTLNKKTGYIHCHKNLVKFTRPFYEDLFLFGKEKM